MNQTEKYRTDENYRRKRILQKQLSNFRIREKMRKEILEALGNKCAECGFSNWKALEIDHVKNNGNEERKALKNYDYYYRLILKKIKEGSKDYQLLCASCNRIKEIERKEIEREKRKTLLESEIALLQETYGIRKRKKSI